MEAAFLPIAVVVKAWIRIMGWQLIVTGEEHLPDGPAVLASNHVSYLDPIMLGWVTERHRRVPRFLAKQELFDRRLLGWLMRRVKQVPVDRYGDRASSLRVAAQRLRAGDYVVVFPEGTISTSFVPAEPRTGAARLALDSGAPLVPVALWGGQRILTKRRPRNLQRGVALMICIGPPVPYAGGEPPDVVTKRLWEAVNELLDGAQCAYPQQPVDEGDRWWLPRHLGGTAPTVAESAEQRRQEQAARRARRDAERER
jgi:1-acyl-sn-glycerol-3-phosphate acyltransferase